MQQHEITKSHDQLYYSRAYTRGECTLCQKWWPIKSALEKELTERVLYCCIYLGGSIQEEEEEVKKEKRGLKERNDEALDSSCRRR